MTASRNAHPITTSLMVSVSGVRGIIGEGLRPETITLFASAFGTYIGKGPVMVGKDTRPSGIMVENAVTAGLMSVGTDIINIGIATTPTIQYAVHKHDAAGGIIISASHNPEQWNAIKFLGKDGLLLTQQQGMEVVEIAESHTIEHVNWNHLGGVSHFNKANDEHIDAVLSLPFISINSIKRKKFTVALDCVNGAGGSILPRFLKKLGCRVVPVHCSLSGIFPHNPEPVSSSLKDLSQAVKSSGADIGFATDPDGDRLAVVDENGVIWGEEYTLVASIDYFLKLEKTPVVINVSTTMAVEDICGRYDSPVYRAKVGEINVIQKMMEVQSAVGGEGNGGVIFPGVHYGRDSLIGIILILQSLTDQGISASKLRASFPTYYMIKEKIRVDGMYFSKVVRQLENRVNSSFTIDKSDGFKILGDDWWVHFRKSNTEPIIRLIIEAKTKKKLKELRNHYIHLFEETRNV